MRRGTGKRGSTHAVLGVFIKNDGLELGVLTGVKATGANLTPQHHDNRAHAERTQPLTSAPTLMLANPVSVLNISQNVVLPVAGVPVTKIFGREREEADIPGNALRKTRQRARNTREMSGRSANSSPSRVQEAIAGGISGVLCRLVVAPMDLLKIRFQLQHAPVGPAKFVSTLSSLPPPAHSSRTYTSMLQAVRRIYQEEGLLALWR